MRTYVPSSSCSLSAEKRATSATRHGWAAPPFLIVVAFGVGGKKVCASGHCTFAAVHKKEICEIDRNGKARPHSYCWVYLGAGATAMAGTQWTNKRRALAVSAFTLAFAVLPG